VAGERVLVTGGRGFIGTAAVRRLLDGGTAVRVLTRRPEALPSDIEERVECVAGALGDPAAIRAAVSGCAAIVHCARSGDADPSRGHDSDVAGTVALLDSARAAGVRRFVHLSTISVYPVFADGRIDEMCPYGRTTDHYSAAKRRIEAEVLARQADWDVRVLQPANVYGPGRGWWGHDLPALMRRGIIILVNAGEGTANLVHVDDVARAIALAVGGRGVPGGRYLLTDGRPLPWREYFAGLERLVGHPATRSMTASDAKRTSRRLRDASLATRAARRLARALTGRPPLFPLDDDAVERYASRAVFVIDRARRELGFAPLVDLATGLASLAAADGGRG
jgi:nucleoside-diphosphate-sugar epimerase